MQSADNQQYNGGVNRYALIGKLFTSQKFLPRYNEVSVLKKLTIRTDKLHMYHQHLSIMVLTDSLETMAA